MKRLSVLLALGAWALAPSTGCADETLGRLFYTPEQRARMDVARQHERSVKIDEEESVPQSANILLNGVITRSDGKSTLWINNRIQNETSRAATVGKGGEVRIVTPDAKRTVPLKVGQSIDLSSGQVEEIYRRPSPVHAPGKEAPPAATPGTVKPPALPGRKDDLPTDAPGETSPQR
jgi:hypothetical protein